MIYALADVDIGNQNSIQRERVNNFVLYFEGRKMSKAYAHIPIDRYVCTQLKTIYVYVIQCTLYSTRIRVISRLHLNTVSKEFKKKTKQRKKENINIKNLSMLID